MGLHTTARNVSDGHLKLHAWQKQFLDMLMAAPLFSLPIMPIHRQRIHDEEVFYFPDPGHDPRNHHGKHMHPTVADFRITGHHFEMIIVDDYLTSFDPRNRVGRFA